MREGLTKRNTLRVTRLLSNRRELGLDLVDDALALEVEDLDAGRGGGAEPVAVRGEDERVDRVSGLERVEVLALVEVPEHGDAVLASGRAERAIGRDGDGRDVAGVAEVVRAQLALGELPNLFGRDRTSQRAVLGVAFVSCGARRPGVVEGSQRSWWKL